MTIFLIIVIIVLAWLLIGAVRAMVNMQKENGILHFDRTHFTATTIGGRVFLYCPVGNICSWSQGDVEHKWCEYCKKGFEEIAK